MKFGELTKLHRKFGNSGVWGTPVRWSGEIRVWEVLFLLRKPHTLPSNGYAYRKSGSSKA
jgi:hypothetical protein